MRNVLGVSVAIVTLAATGFVACGSGESEFDGGGGGASGDGGSGGLGDACLQFGGCTTIDPGDGAPACEGLACKIAKCSEPGQVKTSLSGKVFDPAGKVPLYNVLVYITADPTKLAPITLGLGAKCDRCDGETTGILLRDPADKASKVYTLTDASGAFTLDNVPADTELTLVMQIGKWRRQVKIPAVKACEATALTDANLTRLPRNRNEGDLPRIAIATGGADPMECLFRKIGVDAAEFGTAGNAEARIHLYEGGSTPDATVPQIATKSFQAGGDFAKATSVWGDKAKLKDYDIVVLSCEGGENPAAKPEATRQALYDYAKEGGRIFTSHYHHYWFSNSPVPAVKALATWTNDFTSAGPFVAEPAPDVTVNATVNVGFEKGKQMKQWLANTGALTGAGETLPINEMRHNIDATGPGLLSWMTVQNPAAANRVAHEYASFNTPVGAADADICGRVVYSDLHVVPSAQPGGDKTNVPFPAGCNQGELTPQQKALEFMLFDLSSCIRDDAKPPSGPR